MCDRTRPAEAPREQLVLQASESVRTAANSPSKLVPARSQSLIFGLLCEFEAFVLLRGFEGFKLKYRFKVGQLILGGTPIKPSEPSYALGPWCKDCSGLG